MKSNQNRTTTFKVSDDRSWRAFYVKPRHEKKVAKRLYNGGIEVFCPLTTVKVRWSDRLKSVQKPLINGYVFAWVTEKERREVVTDHGIYKTVFWNGEPATIREDEIEVMRLLINDAYQVETEPYQPGDRVKVTGGGYVLGIAGLEGVVLKVLGNRITLCLEGLKTQLSVTVPPHILSLITPAASCDVYCN